VTIERLLANHLNLRAQILGLDRKKDPSKELQVKQNVVFVL